MAALRQPFDRHRREYRRLARKLFSKAELRAASEISQRVRREYHTSNLTLGPGATEWAANYARFRSKLRGEMTRALPSFRGWQALLKAQRLDHQHLVRLERAAMVDPRVHVSLDDVLPPDAGETYEFTPPFAVHDVDIDYYDDAEVDDRSLADPSGGFLVNRIDFAQEADSLIFTDLYGINWITRHLSSVACGINFTTPAEGRVRVAATLQNFFNNIVIALRDRFGLSEGYLRVYVRLLIVVIQGNRVSEFTTTLVHDGYDSPGGVEATYQFPSLDSTTPYVIEMTTEEVIPANSGLQILAGTQVFISSEVDDMATYVNALLGWQLQKLTINIV